MDYNGSQNNNQNNVNSQQYNVPQNGQQYGSQQYGTPNTYGTVPPAFNPNPAPQANPNNGMAIGSLICGIVGILLCCCCGIGALVGIVGLVLAILSRKPNGGKFSGLAVGGLVCSIIAIVFSSGYLIYYFAMGGAAITDWDSFLNSYGYYY